MSMPNHFDVVQALYDQYRTSHLTGIDDEKRREWTYRVAQTLAAKYPSEGWGAKRADPSRPLSKDVIALNRTPLVGVELLIGAGTAHPVAEWVEIDIAGQTFEPVAPYDWLDGPLIPDPDPDPGVDVQARLARIEAAFDALVKSWTVSVGE